jgi:CubicO group peptidase (beta-lactamase class C family)
LGGLYANLYARLHPAEVAGVVFVDATAPEDVARFDDLGIPFGGLGDPNSPKLRLGQPGVRQEIEGVVSLTRQVLGAQAFPLVPVVSLRAGPADLLADDPQLDAWYQALGALGSPGETRRVTDSGHDIQFYRPDAVVKAVSDVLATVARSADSVFISSVLADAASKYGVPGLVAAVIDEKGAVIGATGVRQLGSSAPVRAGDLFQNGSTTKAMTATLAGVLVDRGQIRWNTTIGQACPDLRGVIRPEYMKVTLEQLLQHRGGIISDDDASSDLFSAVAALDQSDPRAARAAIMPVVLKEPAHPVGEFRYSNAGYTIAAAMLERVTKLRYEDLMQTYVFGPLGMASATFGPPPAGQPVGHDPSGHPVPYGSPDYLTRDLPILNPAGMNLRMSVADWAKFVRAHMGQTVNGVNVLKPATLARLHTPRYPELSPGVNYAGGWGIAVPGTLGADPALGKILQHAGSDGYWLAEVQAYPDRRFAVLIMANTAESADGQDLSAAFRDINARLTERFV